MEDVENDVKTLLKENFKNHIKKRKNYNVVIIKFEGDYPEIKIKTPLKVSE